MVILVRLVGRVADLIGTPLHVAVLLVQRVGVDLQLFVLQDPQVGRAVDTITGAVPNQSRHNLRSGSTED